MNGLEVTIGTSQSICAAICASEEVGSALPSSQSVAVPVVTEVGAAVSVPVSQAVSLTCEPSELSAPVFSAFGVVGNGDGTVTVSWTTSVPTTTMARHYVLGPGASGYVYTSEAEALATSHTRKLTGDLEEGQQVRWQGGGETGLGAFYWSATKGFAITDGEPIPEED